MVKNFYISPVEAIHGAFEAYLGKTGSEHKSKWESLQRQGYRFISLSVFGDPIRYAAVLVKRNGPKREHTTGSINNLKDEIAHYRRKNFAPTIISIAGAANNATYAMVWEEGAFDGGEKWKVSPFEPKTNEDFFAEGKSAQENGYYLISPTMYGDTSDVRYAAIWARYSDTQPIRWFINVTDEEEQFKGQ